jgi:hypothetical protein
MRNPNRRVTSIAEPLGDTSIEYIQQHYFHYDAKRATGALATGRKSLKAAIDDD